MAKKGSLFCRHHQVVEEAEAPAIEHDNSLYENMSQQELYNFAFNKSNGHIKLDINAPIHVMIARLNTFNLNDF